MKTTMTLSKIRAHGPCSDGWRRLLSGLGTDDPATVVDLRDILRINGPRDAWWATRCLPKRERVALATMAARTVSYLHPQAAATLDVCDRWLAGAATDEEMEAARSSAWAAMSASDSSAWASEAAARSAAWAAEAWAAEAAAEEAARSSAWAAARASAWSHLGELMRNWCEEQEAAK